MDQVIVGQVIVGHIKGSLADAGRNDSQRASEEDKRVTKQIRMRCSWLRG